MSDITVCQMLLAGRRTFLKSCKYCSEAIQLSCTAPFDRFVAPLVLTPTFTFQPSVPPSNGLDRGFLHDPSSVDGVNLSRFLSDRLHR